MTTQFSELSKALDICYREEHGEGLSREEKKELFRQWRALFQDAHNKGIQIIRISTMTGVLFPAFLLNSESTIDGDFEHKKGTALCYFGEFSVEYSNSDIWVSADLKNAIAEKNKTAH